MKTLLELRNYGGTDVTRECVRDGKIITAQTHPSHREFYREIIAQWGTLPTFCRAAAGRHATRSVAAGARVSAEENLYQRRVIGGRSSKHPPLTLAATSSEKLK